MAAAEASAAGQGGGLGSSVLAGVAILGLGLAGLTGGFLVAAARRRRVAGSTTAR